MPCTSSPSLSAAATTSLSLKGGLNLASSCMPESFSVTVDPFAQMLAAEFYEIGLPARIEPAHALQMRGEIALLDEVVDRRLQDQRRELAGDRDRLVEGHRQFARHDQIADAQRRDQRLAEAADVDDAVGVIEAAQRRHRAAAEAVLAVIIVLDDPGAVALGDVEQLQPLLDAHDGAERPLAGRRDIDQPWRRQVGVGRGSSRAGRP